jgi:uncharacterized protein YrrD
MNTTDFQNQGETNESITPEPEQPELEQQQQVSELESPDEPNAKEPEYPIQKTEGQSAQIFLHRTIVNIDNGEKLGSVSDLLFNPVELKVAAVTTATGKLLQRGTLAIPANQIRVWGKDFLLIEGKGESLQNISLDHERWLSLTNNIKGKQVLSSDGIRLGQIEDVNIDNGGKIIDFRLAQVFVKGPLYESMRIPVAVTHSLGKDALIIDIEEISEPQVGSEDEE